jgi:hypothetical protein
VEVWAMTDQHGTMYRLCRAMQFAITLRRFEGLAFQLFRRSVFASVMSTGA